MNQGNYTLIFTGITNESSRSDCDGKSFFGVRDYIKLRLHMSFGRRKCFGEFQEHS